MFSVRASAITLYYIAFHRNLCDEREAKRSAFFINEISKVVNGRHAILSDRRFTSVSETHARARAEGPAAGRSTLTTIVRDRARKNICTAQFMRAFPRVQRGDTCVHV